MEEYIEVKIKHNTSLQQYVSQALISMEEPTTLHDSRRAEEEKISLPGYIFVEAPLVDDVARTLRFVPDCLGFLGGLSNPPPVPRSKINRILGEVEDTEIMNKIEVSYKVDEVVKVTDGSSSGLSGVIEEVNAEKHKLKALVEIFGRRAPLKLSLMQVEKGAQRSYGR